MDDPYLIWSNEHRAWWAPGRHGYTTSLADAGRYSREAALQICTRGIIGTALRLGMLPELPIRWADAEAMRDTYVAHHKWLPPEDWM